MPAKKSKKSKKSNKNSNKSKSSKSKKSSARCPVCLEAFNKTTRRPVRLHAATRRQPEHRACATCRAKIIARSVRPLCPLCRTPIRVAPRTSSSPSVANFSDFPDFDIPEFAPPIARQAPPVRITAGMPALVRQSGFSDFSDF